MKKIIFLLSILISFTAQSQCVIDGTTYSGTTKARTFKSCDAIIQSLSNGIVKSHGDSLKTAVPDVDYATPALASNGFTNWSNTKQYATGNTVIFGNLIYTANTTPTIGANPGGNSQWTLQVINTAAYSGAGSWSGVLRAPTMNNVGIVFDAIYDSLANLTPVDTSLFLKKSGGTMVGNIKFSAGDKINNSSGQQSFDPNACKLYYPGFSETINYFTAELSNPFNLVTCQWSSMKLLGNWKLDAEHTDSLSVATYSQIPIDGSRSQALVAATTITVTIGVTMPNTSYRTNVTPTSALSAALFYVTNKTTTTFDVVYLAGITGTVTFDWAVFR